MMMCSICYQRIGIGIGGVGNKKESGDNQNNGITEIVQDANKWKILKWVK